MVTIVTAPLKVPSYSDAADGREASFLAENWEAMELVEHRVEAVARWAGGRSDDAGFNESDLGALHPHATSSSSSGQGCCGRELRQ